MGDRQVFGADLDYYDSPAALIVGAERDGFFFLTEVADFSKPLFTSANIASS